MKHLLLSSLAILLGAASLSTSSPASSPPASSSQAARAHLDSVSLDSVDRPAVDSHDESFSPSSTASEAILGLIQLAPDADPQVLALGLSAMQCAQAHGTAPQARRLAVIDYSRSSLQPRLWVFDLAQKKLLYKEWVAHGQGSGGDIPDRFSNDEGTHASSLGLFVTRDTYQGRNGYSLRMHGLDAGFNDAALSRAIVMHGAAYVDADAGRRMGRLGRSWGCPAVRAAVARPIIDVLKDGQFVFSYYPQQAWLTRSSLAQCAAARRQQARLPVSHIAAATR